MSRPTMRNISSSAGWKRRWSNCRAPNWHAGWQAHPEGYVVMYLKSRQNLDAIPARHKQAYRGEAAVLVDAQTAARLLAAHVE